ncbi:MAG: hypothetical protein KBT12_06360 [Bacteroidales bacterium]|nr:hypothetical protein [Candidatus Physcousia equi]
MDSYAFTGWTEQGSTDVLSTELQHTVSDLLATSTDKNKPTTYNDVAHFNMLETIESGTYFIKNDATYNVKHPGFESKLNDCWIATGSTNMNELDSERSGDFSVESKNAAYFSVELPDGVLANTEEIYYRFDVPEAPEVNVEATYVEASKCVILTFPDCDEVDFGTNTENVTIDDEQVTIEYGQELNEMYIYKELAAGEHTIVLSAGSITLDGTANENDITVTLNIEGKPVLAQVAVTQNEETKTYTITSDNEKLAVVKLVKNMDYLDEGKTPETALLDEIEGLSSVFFSEDDFTNGYLEFGAEFAPITIDPSQYTEVYEAGTEMFIIAAQIGWNAKEGKVTLMSNVSETITFTVPEAPAEVNVEATYVDASKCVILTFPRL